MNRTLLLLALFSILASQVYADQGSFTNSGGSTSVGTGVSVNSTVASPAGTLAINCPGTGTGACAGGNFSFAATDGSVSISASFLSGSFVESCAGGGKGGHVTCGYSFSGSFSGTLTLNSQTQAITGVTAQGFGTGGAAAQGNSAYNSAYTPFYYSDSEQIHRSDDLLGTNQISFGSQGDGVGQFYGAYGIALDAAHRIYIADTYNCRIVRIDDMNGANWTTYGGTCGSAPGQFYDPSGIAIDPAGRIYIMDAGNSRIVRMDDLNGTNWIAYGTVGSGMGQFAQYLQSLAVDSASRIYVADTGNLRIVRMDDMTGANWTVLASSPLVNGASYSFSSPVAVTLDSSGRIYVIDNEYYQPAVVRVDDITGANWKSIYVGAGGGPNSIAVDSSGLIFLGGGGARLVDNMSAVQTSSGAIGPIGSYYVFGITPVPLPSPRPSAIGFSPATLTFTQNVGTSSSQPVTIGNFGGSPLGILSVAASGGGFSETNNCPGTLLAGSNCTVTVSFAPTATGPASGLLTVSDSSGNAGSSQTIALTGTGTAPAATITPTTLSFSSQVEGTTSNPRSVTVQNSGTGPMQVTGVTATAPFTQTNTCTAASIAPGASCTIQVSFTPATVGAISGTLTIADNAGTQTVGLSGTGSAPVSLSSSSLSFGTVAVGNTSAAKTVTLTNREKVALNFTGVATSAGFAVASNTCGASIAAGASCSVGVMFTPSAIGAATGTLTFTDDALSSPQTVSLTGTGSAPVTLSSSSLSLGTVAAGNTSAAKTVTLTNHENGTLNFTSIAVSAGFAIASNTCAPGVAAAGTCTVGVTFTPTTTGAVTGTLAFTDGAGTQTVSLTGTGSTPVTLSSATLSFGTITVGTTSPARSVTLTNRQNVVLSFTAIQASAGFAIASNTCGASIAAGASCSVGVTFSPTAAGAATGTLTFTDSAWNSPQTVSLTGTGK